MSTDKSTNPGSGSRENQISAMRKQLLSSSPDDVRRGIDQVRQWLIDNPEDRETYKLIINVTRENSSLKDEFHSLLKGMSDKGFAIAEESLIQLNKLSTINFKNIIEENYGSVSLDINTQVPSDQILMNQADEAYYAAEFDKAILLYQQILQIQPDSQRAQQQLAKAELNRYSGKPSLDIPRDAMKFYRQARSFIAAKDFHTAINLLSAAAEEAHAKGIEFREANMSLNRLQDLLTATEYKAKADKDVQDGNWGNALDQYKKALRLDPSDEASINMRDSLQSLLSAEALLDPFGIQASTDRNNKLELINVSLRDAEKVIELVNTTRYKIILAKKNLYEAELYLHRWGFFTVFVPQRRLKESQQAAKHILSPSDPALKYVERQARQFISTRIAILIAIITVGFAIVLFVNGKFTISPPPINPTLTSTLSFTNTPTPSKTHTSTLTSTVTNTPTFVYTATVTLTPTPPSLDSGFVNLGTIHAQVKPNSTWIIELNRFQSVIILDQAIVSGDRWYFCKWEKNGITQTGWILAEYIILGPTPTPRPTFSP